MDKDTRNAIERATQRARKLLEEDFEAQLEGAFDKRAAGMSAAEAVADYVRDAAFTTKKVIVQ